jgi:hypothetical protein
MSNEQQQRNIDAATVAKAPNFNELRRELEQAHASILQMREAQREVAEHNYRLALVPWEAESQSVEREQALVKEARARLIATAAPQLRLALADVERRQVEAKDRRRYFEECQALNANSKRAEELAKTETLLAELQQAEAAIVAQMMQP